MLTLLKYDKIFVLFFIPILVIGIWMPQFFNYTDIPYLYNKYPMPFYEIILNLINVNSFIGGILCIIIVSLNALLIIRTNGVNQLTTKSTFLPGIIVVMLILAFPGVRQLNPIIFSSFLILFAANILFLTYKTGNNLRPFFEAGFLVGIASMFYFNSIFFILFVITSIAILRSFNWREYVVPVLGLLVVYFGAFTWFFYFDKTDEFINTILGNLLIKRSYTLITLSKTILLGFLGFIFLISIFLSFTSIVKKIIIRKIYNQFFVWLALVVLMYFLIPSVGEELIIFLAIPLSIYMSNYLLNINSVPLSEIIFTTFVGLFIFSQFGI